MRNLVPGLAAYCSGQVRIGDTLIGVDTQSTENLSFSEVRSLIVGPIGSRVDLTFLADDGETYVCRGLVRGSTGNSLSEIGALYQVSHADPPQKN